jgi:transposase
MANSKLAMRKIREILRLRWSSNLSLHKIAESLGISSSPARQFVHRAQAAGLSWPLPDDLDDVALDQLLYPKPAPQKEKPEPDWSHVHSELKRKGVTLTLLWHEYKADNPDGYQLSQFCHHYQQWRRKLKLSMKQQHRAGEKVFCDFAGGKLPVTDPATGEVRYAHIFVSALRASSLSTQTRFSPRTRKVGVLDRPRRSSTSAVPQR